jgi:hypothetical protein
MELDMLVERDAKADIEFCEVCKCSPCGCELLCDWCGEYPCQCAIWLEWGADKYAMKVI